MIVLFYLGDHKGGGLAARLGYWLIRAGQVGMRHGRVTHCEIVLDGDWRSCTIAGSTMLDGGCVRVKTTDLTPGNWLALDVPAWNISPAKTWIAANLGTRYCKWGAVASALWLALAIAWALKGVTQLIWGTWCSRTLGDAVGVNGAEDLCPAELCALALSMPGTKDITADFFGS